mmetsp:Transcript_127794/g.190438  ORF Transcript_127794/g.190438 Transcript_127794/m.190438 type:complete len:88 (+) Transcript_127794:646-909(+)
MLGVRGVLEPIVNVLDPINSVLDYRVGGCIRLGFFRVCKHVSVNSVIDGIGGIVKRVMDAIGVSRIIDGLIEDALRPITNSVTDLIE